MRKNLIIFSPLLAFKMVLNRVCKFISVGTSSVADDAAHLNRVGALASNCTSLFCIELKALTERVSLKWSQFRFDLRRIELRHFQREDTTKKPLG